MLFDLTFADMDSIDILYEDNHLLAVNKPAGMLSQGDDTGDEPLVEAVKQYIKNKYQKPGNVFVGLVHRLDRPVGGVILLAKTSKALSRLNAAFGSRDVEKTYLALCISRPVEWHGTLTHYLIKNQANNTTKAYKSPKEGAKMAVLEYQTISIQGEQALLEIKPQTGRSHQIRAQLAAMGCPIVGDLRYGALTANKDASICLFAKRLQLMHPTLKTKLLIEAPSPAWAI